MAMAEATAANTGNDTLIEGGETTADTRTPEKSAGDDLSQLGREFFDAPVPKAEASESGSSTCVPGCLDKPAKQQPRRSFLAKQRTAALIEKPAEKPAQSKWSMFNNLIDVFEEKKLELVAKKEEFEEKHLPHLRDMRHKAKEMHLNVKEQVNEKKQQIMNQVVSGLEVSGAEHAATASATAASEELEAKRWWAEACKASHELHYLTLDAPKPPNKGFSEASGAQGVSLRTPTFARGCLEVEVLSFATEPRMSLPNGAPAQLPVCQLAIGSRFTGSLFPRICSVLPRKSSGDSVDEIEGTAEIAEETVEPKEIEGSNADANSIARFAIDEINGCDLRLHVFDRKARRYMAGKENEAFCGGALIPLSLLVGRQQSWTKCAQGFYKQEIQDEIRVKLLPLDVMSPKLRKLRSPPDVSQSIERPSPELGHVSLRLHLTLYDMAPGALYTATPCRNSSVDQSGSTHGKIDDPLSVLKAVATAVQRLRAALAVEFWRSVVDDLREMPGTAAILHMLWASIMFVHVSRIPAVIFAMVVLVICRVSSAGKAARHAEPPKFYKDDFDSDDTALTLKERGMKGLAGAVKVELGMMTFAQTLNKVSANIEKVNYLLMLRDPYLSILLGGFLVVSLVSVTVSLYLFLLIFGGFGPPLLLWASGTLLLLPRPLRDRVFVIFEWVHAMKIRFIGPARIKHILESLWERIPDEIEVQHCDLFERCCMAYD